MHIEEPSYLGADKSLVRPGKKQAKKKKIKKKKKKKKKKKILKDVGSTRSPRQRWPPCQMKNGDLPIVFSVASGQGLIITPVLTN
jgi:hypothetical protein